MSADSGPVLTKMLTKRKNGCIMEAMKIHFTNQGTLKNFRNFAETLDFGKLGELSISMDERWVNANPAQLALTAALALEVGKEHTKIEGKAPTSARYLDRMGLYDFVSTPSPFEEYDHKEPSGRFIPLTIIKDGAGQSRFVTDMIPLFHLDAQNSRILSYIVGELVRNTLEHSYARNGAIVAAQYYKKSNRVSFAICDTGIGLWKSLQVWHPRTDKDAIQLALMPGISGTTRRLGGTAENAGAGLFFIKSIAKISRGYFMIMSGNAEYTLLKSRPDVKNKLFADPFMDHHAFSDKISRFNGTLVAVDFKLDKTQDFTELLAEIREVYETALVERKKESVRRPIFA